MIKLLKPSLLFLFISISCHNYTDGHFYSKYRDSGNSIPSNEYEDNRLERSPTEGRLNGYSTCDVYCLSDSACCKGYMCSWSETNIYTKAVGHCVLFLNVKRGGRHCTYDSECYPGVCVYHKPEGWTCKNLNTVNKHPSNLISVEKKQFNDECKSNQDCAPDLCCARVRPYRKKESLRCRYVEGARCLADEQNWEESNTIDTDGAGEKDSDGSSVQGAAGEHPGKGGSMNKFFHMKLKPYF